MFLNEHHTSLIGKSVRTPKYSDMQHFRTIVPATTLIPFETGMGFHK